jgi:hypothetical protein
MGGAIVQSGGGCSAGGNDGVRVFVADRFAPTTQRIGQLHTGADIDNASGASRC